MSVTKKDISPLEFAKDLTEILLPTQRRIEQMTDDLIDLPGEEFCKKYGISDFYNYQMQKLAPQGPFAGVVQSKKVH